MQKNPALPEWFTKLIDKYHLSQSWLTINVSDVSQLSELSKDQIAFFMSMVKFMNADLPESQLADEILSLGPREVEEKVTAIDIVVSRSQRVGLQLSTITHQVNQNSPQHIQHQTVHIGTQHNFFGMSGIPNTSTTNFKSDGPFRDCFGLPPEFEDFTGREDSLALLEANAGQSTVISHPKKRISGTGGIGKTQLAVTFAHGKLKQYRETQGKVGYRSVIWFIAGTDEGIDNQGLMTEQLHRLGQQLGFDPKQFNTDALVKLIFQRLSEDCGRYLVVYDNAYDYRSIKPYLPPASVPVIITTRNGNDRDWDQTFKSISLNVFTLKEAYNYIKKVLDRNHPELFRAIEANMLAEVLGYFPLALTQALAYITTETTQINEYIEAFRQQKEMYLQEPVPQGDPYQEDKNPAEDKYAALTKEEYDPQKATVWTVVQLSLKKVMNPDAHQILKACAYLAPEAPIDTKLLTYWANGQFECQEAVRSLRRYSLVENSELNGHIRVHKIVQEVLSSEEDIQDRKIWWEMVTNCIQKFCDNQDKSFKNNIWMMHLLPHLTILHAEISKQRDDTTLRFTDIKGVISFYFGCVQNEIGDAGHALVLFEEALQSAELIYPPDDPKLAIILTNIGCANNSLGNIQLGINYCERALDIKEKAYGENSDQLVPALLNLANAYCGENVEKARNLYLRAITILEKNEGQMNPDLGLLLNNLGFLYFHELRKLDQAKNYFERGLAVVERTVGQVHELKVQILSNLSELNRALDNLPKAKELALDALKISEKLYGDEGQLVAGPLIALGSVCIDLGRPKEALVHYKRALSIVEKFSAQNIYNIATLLMNIGVAYQGLGKLEKVATFYKRAIGIMEANNYINQPLAAKLHRNLATVYLDAGDREQAVVFLEESLRLEEEKYGLNSPLLVNTLFNLGTLCKTIGQINKAIKYFDRANRIRDQILDRDHLEVNNSSTMTSKLEGNKELCSKPSIALISSPVEDPVMKFIVNILECGTASLNHILKIADKCSEKNLFSEALILLDFVLQIETSVEGLLLLARCQLGRCDIKGAFETASLAQALSEGHDAEVNALENEIKKFHLHAKQWQTEIVASQSQSVLSIKDQVKCAINLRRLSRFDEALKILDMIISNKPSVNFLAPAYFNQALCFFGLQRYEDAQKSANVSYQLNSDPRAGELINKIKLVIEITTKLTALTDKLTQGSARAFTL